MQVAAANQVVVCKNEMLVAAGTWRMLLCLPQQNVE
jgi:hypothetical protein